VVVTPFKGIFNEVDTKKFRVPSKQPSQCTNYRMLLPHYISSTMAPPNSKQQSAAASTRDHKAAKKRKRPEQQLYGMDLPQIPGIPIEILPMHVQALKVCSIYFRRHAATEIVLPYPSTENTESENNAVEGSAQRMYRQEMQASAASSSSVMEALFHRIEHGAAQAEALTDTGRERRECWQQKEQAVTTWLQAIHRWIRDNNKHRCSGPPQEQQPRGTNDAGVPVVAVLKHLLKVAMEHRKVNVQRAATHMASYLLRKSSDGRRWLLDEAADSMLLSWMDAVSSHNDNNTTTEAELILVRLWQRESYLLLHHLESEAYSDLYPTLAVAVQRFQQLCPAAARGSTTEVPVVPEDATARSMAERRTIRDLALRHAATEEGRVRKLMARAHACTDILVPRVTDDLLFCSTAITTKPSSGGGVPKQYNAVNAPDNDGDDDDDDGVDWEDGWENENNAVAQEHDVPVETTAVSHAMAVEHTLAAMASAGGLQGGELQVDFAKPEETLNGHSHSEAIYEQARQRLQKVVDILESRHMPRLSSWVDCLMQADGLVVVPQIQQDAATGSSTIAAPQALVSMPPSQFQRRNEVLRRMLNLKREVASVLSSAKRLGLDSGDSAAEAATTAKAVNRRPRAVATATHLASTLQRRNQSLEVNISRRQQVATRAPKDITHQRSNRIQIKYRKD
jgi:hypothetical protein